MSSLTRIPLDSANVDISSGLTKSVLKFCVSEDIVNSIYKFQQHCAEILSSEIRSTPLTKFKINWVHRLLKKTGTLDESWQLTQCLFGEYLLSQYPDKPIALVESEKTAIICSALIPQYLWHATGGKSQLSQDKLSVLAGRRTIAFPDIDGYEEWKRKLLAIDLNITVSDILQRSATDEQRAAHIDIADLIIQWKQDGEPLPGRSRKLQISERTDWSSLLDKWFPAEYHPEIQALIEDFDLIPVTEERTV